MENIVIKNITRTTAGTVDIIPFDPAVATLNSGGTTTCLYTNVATNITARALRGLSAVDSTLSIDYDIVDPSAGLLSMDPSEFSATLENDPAIADLSTTLGSSAVFAVAPPELALSSAVPPDSSVQSPQTAQNTISYAILGEAGAFVVGGAIVGAVVLFMTRRSAPTPTFKKTSPTVIVFETDNPLNGGATSAPPAPAGRQTFEPTTIRAGSHV
jgi:hypothetical protein